MKHASGCARYESYGEIAGRVQQMQIKREIHFHEWRVMVRLIFVALTSSAKCVLFLLHSVSVCNLTQWWELMFDDYNNNNGITIIM